MWMGCLCALLSGCKGDLEERVDDLEERVETPEELCLRMNTNLSSLQSLVDVLSAEDRITGVAPVSNGSETIGYTITFAENEPITIYNGRDAAAPVIGVRPDDQGVYCWTLDGQWLTVGNHERIPVRGMTPQLKVEEGRWYVSYDGTAWTEVDVSGEKTGVFRSLSMDGEYVYITLNDGTVLTVPLAGTVAVDAILFEDDLVKSVCVTRWDTDGNGELSMQEAAA